MNSGVAKVFTVCTFSHFAQALVSMRSLPANISKTIWLIDRCAQGFPYIQNIDVRFMDELSNAFDLVSDRQYDPFELNCSLRPYIAHLMLQESAAGDVLAYVDADIYFYGDPGDILFPEKFCFLLTPHFSESPPRFCPNSEVEVNQAGLYNSGLIMFRVCPKSADILKWWWSRLREKCYNDTSRGLFVDQIWLNYLPLYFEGDIFVSKQGGVNVGHWNLHQNKVEMVGDAWQSNGDPLICYHFSGYSLDRPDVLSKHQSRWDFSNNDQLRLLYEDYCETWASAFSDWSDLLDDFEPKQGETFESCGVYVAHDSPLDIYFVANIFDGDQAGIYRYSLEIAKRLHKDSRVNLRFVYTGEGSEVSLNARLGELFGPDVSLYDKRKIFGHVFRGCHAVFFRNLYFKYKNLVKRDGRKYLKPVKEFYRLFSQLEELLWSYASLHFDGKKPVVFTPYAFPKGLDIANTGIVSVQVVHDLIPLIRKECFDCNKDFLTLLKKFPDTRLLLAVSEHTRGDILEHSEGVVPERVHAITIAASEHFSPVKDESAIELVKLKYGIPLESDYVFSLSTIEPRKNHIRLLQAWNLVFEKLELNMPKLVIGGARAWGNQFQKELTASIKTSNSLIMTGFIDDEDLPVLYSGSAFTVYPSLYEGFGIPILESMKCGRFCLTSNVSSMPEITGPDVPLVDPHSVESIAEGILRVANNCEYRLKLEKLMLERSKLFTWDKTYRRTFEVIAAQIDHSVSK